MRAKLCCQKPCHFALSLAQREHQLPHCKSDHIHQTLRGTTATQKQANSSQKVSLHKKHEKIAASCLKKVNIECHRLCPIQQQNSGSLRNSQFSRAEQSWTRSLNPATPEFPRQHHQSWAWSNPTDGFSSGAWSREHSGRVGQLTPTHVNSQH